MENSDILLVVIAAAALLLSGCESTMLQGTVLDRSSITLSFFINETGLPLDGSVLLGDQLLGNTTNGTIVLNRKELVPGILTLAGSDFNFYFSLDSPDISLRRINFQVTANDYEEAVFDASKLDLERIEREIFGLANEERAKFGIKPLSGDNRIAGVARAYSKVLASEGFHHTDEEGKDVKDRFNEAGIVFLVAGENLFSSSSVTRQADLAREAVDGWLKSPSHRATLLDRDSIYSDAGVGVYCENKECFVVMNFAALRQEQKTTLKKGWITFHYLNNPGYNFPDSAIPVRLVISASSAVNAYIVPSYESYKGFIDGKQVAMLQEFKATTGVDTTIEAAAGTGVIIEAESGDSEIQLSVDFKNRA